LTNIDNLKRIACLKYDLGKAGGILDAAAVSVVSRHSRREVAYRYTAKKTIWRQRISSDDGVIKGITSSIAGVLSWGLLDKPATSLKEADVIAQKLVKRWVTATASVSWVPGSTLLLMGMDYKIYKGHRNGIRC